MKNYLLAILTLSAIAAIGSCANARRPVASARCDELRQVAGVLVGTGDDSTALSLAPSQSGPESELIQSVLNQWNAIRSEFSLDEIQRVAVQALPCIEPGGNSLGLFVATAGLMKDQDPALRKFSRTWFFSDGARDLPVASLGRAALAEKDSNREVANIAITQGLRLDPRGVARRAGQMYLSGIFFPSDDAIGATWIQRAADAGDWRSQQAMGVLYKFGRGVSKDAAAAEKYLELARKNSPDQSHAADAAIISITKPNESNRK